MRLEEIQKLPALDRGNSTNYTHVNMTNSISRHDCSIQPRAGIDHLELNHIGVIPGQKTGGNI